ncbi:MAG TPA: FkbM family methyltransferase [Chitinophagaceae bacterium]|nr:FkbM family methyltransferase [Chitinophagaceae bacterium]
MITVKRFLINYKVFRQTANKIGWVTALHYYIQRIFIRKGMIKVAVKGLKYPILLRAGAYDTHIFHQIFIREELKFEYDKNIQVVIDCGANIGLSSLWYKMKFPKARIYAFEPEQENYKILELNTKNYNDIITSKKGIFNKTCTLYIIDIGQGEASYQLREDAGGFKVIGSVECTTLTDVLDSLKRNDIHFKIFDIVKMDVEGSEKACLQESLSDWLKSTRTFLVEFHEDIHPGITNEIKSRLSSYMKISAQGEYTFFQNKLLQ